MAKTFLSETQINSCCAVKEGPENLARTLTAPMPQVMFVMQDPGLGAAGVIVRTATLGPLTWGPYTMSINIPSDDEKVVRRMVPGAQCVLGLPTRRMLRQLAICRLRLPPGVSEARVARLKMCKSLYVDVPSIHDCPINLECVIDHVERYHTHTVAFVRVVGSSIDDGYLFWERERIIQMYPTNFADDVVGPNGAVHMRVSLLKDIYACPTFPVGQKVGWGDSFDKWVRDLADEKYLSPAEKEKILTLHRRWNEAFPNLKSSERAARREELTTLCRLMAGEQWEKVHTFVEAL